MRSLFSGSAFQPHLSALRPSLGLTFNDMKVTWDQYAPAIRTDAKDVRDAIMPATTAPSNSPGPTTNAAALLKPTTPGAPVTSPTNLTTPPAYQPSSPMTPILLVVGALALAGTGAWYFFFRKK